MPPISKRLSHLGNIAPIVKMGAASGGLFLWISQIAGGGTTALTAIGAVAAVDLLGKVCSELSELAKKRAEFAEKTDDPEVWFQDLFKLLALESYTLGTKEGLGDFGRSFRLTASKSIRSESVPNCIDGETASPERLATPVFDYLDGQLLALLAGEAEPNAAHRGFVAQVRASAEKKINKLILQSRYKPVLDHIGRLAQLETLEGVQALRRGFLQTPGTASRTSSSEQICTNIPASSIGSRETLPAPDLTEKVRKLYQSKFDAARREIDAGSCLEGFRLFDEFVKEVRVFEDPSLNDLLARSLHNRGVALHNLLRDEEAAVSFEEASGIPGGNEKVPMSKFFAKSCRKNFADAREVLKTLSVSEETRKIHAAECWLREGKPSEALVELAGVEIATSELLRTHALNALGRYVEGQQISSNAVVKWPEDTQLIIAHAYSCARPIIDRLDKEKARRKKPTQEEAKTLENALSEYRRVKEDCQQHGQRRLLYEVLSWLGILSLNLGREIDAVNFFDEALDLWPNDQAFLANKHFAQIRGRDFKGAIATGHKLANFDRKEGTSREIAALLCADEYPAARALLDSVLKETPDLWFEDSRIGSNLLTVLQSLNDREGMREWIDRMLARDHLDILLLVSCAEALNFLGDAVGADALFERAEKQAVGFEQDLVVGCKGRLLFDRQDWEGTLKLINKEGVDPLETHFADEILWCHVQLGHIHDAIDLGHRMESSGVLSIRGRRALVAAFIRLRNDPEAEKHAAILVERLKGSESDFLNLFELRRRLRPIREALAVLEQGLKALPESVNLHAALSQFSANGGDWRRSVEEAREVSRLSPGSETEKVVWARYAISNLPTSLLTEEEKIRIGQSFATQADIIQVRVFDDNGKFDPSEMVAMLEKKSRSTEDAMRFYNQHQMPGSMMAMALGIPPLEFWWQITRDSNRRWWIAAGTTEEQTHELKVASTASDIVVDYSALLTLSAIGKIDILLTLFTKVYVTVETRRIFVDTWQLRKATLESTATAFTSEGKLVVREHSSEIRAQENRQLSAIIDFLENPAVQIAAPTPEIFEAHRDLLEGEKQKEIVQSGVVVSILAAKSLGIPILSDEQMIRAVARNPELKVEGFSSQSLLILVGMKHPELKIDRSWVAERLLGLNYHFVSVTEGFLCEYLRKTKYAKNNISVRLLSEIASTKYPNKPAAFELGGASSHLWLNRGAGWGVDDWGKIVAEQLVQLGTSTDIQWFTMGAALELRWFPQEAIRFFKYFGTDTRIPSETRNLMLYWFGLLAGTFRRTTFFGNHVNRVWRQAASWKTFSKLVALGMD